jgi:hypothetical protein
MPMTDLPSSALSGTFCSTGEGVLTELLRIVYEIFFSNAPKTLCFTRDFLMAGMTANSVDLCHIFG